MEEFNKFEQLIHDIIFGSNVKISISILYYIDDIILYEDFIKRVTDILKKSSIDLHDEEVNVKKNDITWSFVAKK